MKILDQSQQEQNSSKDCSCYGVILRQRKIKNCIPRYPVVWLLSKSEKTLRLNIHLRRTFLSFLACNYLYILIFRLFSIKQFVSLVVDSNVQKLKMDSREIPKPIRTRLYIIVYSIHYIILYTLSAAL